MKRYLLPLMVAVILLTGVRTVVQAELTPEQAKKAEALIKQFSAREFAVRQAAVQTLIALGPDILPLVRKALAETEDPEVKLRCEMVVKEITKRQKRPTQRVVKRFGYEPSRVTIEVHDADIEDVLAALSQQSGNTLLERPKEWEDRPVSFEVTDVTYWEAVDGLCRAVGLTLDFDRHNRRLRLRPSRGVIESRTCAGPALVLIRPELTGNYYTPEKGENTRVYELHYLWEDRLRIAAAEVTLKSAATPDGTPLPLFNPGSKDEWDGNFPSFGSDGVIMKHLPAGLQVIGTLKGTLTLRQVSAQAHLTVPNVFGREEHEVRGDGLVVRVKVREQPNSRWLTVQAHGVRGGPVVLGGPQDERYGFFLTDPDGRRHRPRTRLLGSWGVTECPHGGWFGANGSGDCMSARTLGFWHLPFSKKGWSLLCICPAQSTSREIPFTLRNVPIPPPKVEERPNP